MKIVYIATHQPDYVLPVQHLGAFSSMALAKTRCQNNCGGRIDWRDHENGSMGQTTMRGAYDVIAVEWVA